MYLKSAALRGTALATVMSASMLLSAPTLAQDAPEADDTRRRDADGEIIVTGGYTIADAIDTATGLGLTIRETPQSVSIITAQRIRDQNLVSIADVVDNAVGVTSETIDDVRNNFYARGFQITNYQIDSVPMAWTLAGGAGETNIDVSIYDRVEIVRGATGLMTGAGEPSASINMVRKQANSIDWTGYADVQYGSWDTVRATADIGGAISADGRVRFRGVARYEQGENFIDVYENEKTVLYGTVEADLTPATEVRAGYSHQIHRPSGVAWGALPTYDSDGNFLDFDRSQTTSAPWTHWNSDNSNLFISAEHDFGNGWRAQVHYNFVRNQQQATLLYFSGFVDPDTGTIGSAYPYKDVGDNRQSSFNGQVNGLVNLFGRDHEIVVGGLHSNLVRDTYTFAPVAGYQATDYPFIGYEGEYPDPGFTDDTTLRVDERVKQTGVYGAVRLNVSDRLKLIGGGRVASWEQRGINYDVPSDFGDDGVFIPYAGALFDLTPNHRLYASYTEIFQPQRELDRNFVQIDPLQGASYEVGLKSAFFNEALQTTIALFRIEQDNVPINSQVAPPSVPGGLPRTTWEVGEGVVSKGFEIEATGEIVPGWNINAGFSLFEAEDADGTDVLTDQPRQLLKLFTTWTPDGGMSPLTIGGGVNYRSRAYQDGSLTLPGGSVITPRFEQGSYALVNLMARYRVTDQLQVQANIENLLDEEYYSQIGFFSQYRWGTPRNVMVGASYVF
ncbi:TonB-dependent siderophore receptor [Croceibacterium sp. TMG7-5b_MA50]|uniref:TonB-dependent siderophore receptor n=1 Tax=Croceibacterium sp. TMG7-5b_MA50 TaxID=3121290 RepID=UPI003221DC00